MDLPGDNLMVPQEMKTCAPSFTLRAGAGRRPISALPAVALLAFQPLSSIYKDANKSVQASPETSSLCLSEASPLLCLSLVVALVASFTVSLEEQSAGPLG
eukprot:gene3189-3713_t